MQLRRGKLCFPVNRIYTKSGRTQFAPTGYDCFFAVMKHKKGTPRRRSFKGLIDFWSVGVATPYKKYHLGFYTPRRERRPRRSAKKNGSAWKPTPTITKRTRESNCSPVLFLFCYCAFGPRAVNISCRPVSPSTNTNIICLI